MRIRIGGNMRLFPLLLLLSALVFLRSVGGPDYGRYEEWAEALLRGSAASIESSTVSPSGMPVSAAAHGTGVVLGIFHLLYPPFFSASLSARCVGVALFLISSLALWGILDAIELQHRLKLLVYSLFLAGTNFGYYFIYLASEAVTSAVIISLSWLVLTKKRNNFSSAIALGVGCCILITSRPQAVLALIPILGVFSWREFQKCDIARSALFFGVVGIGCFTGLLQVMQVNQWMTGSWLHSPYSFGDGTFRSVSLPSFAVAVKVLFSRRVGLLTFTPLLGLAFFASLGLSFRKSLPAEWRFFFGLSCLVNVANLAIISGFYAWNAGPRYFIPSALLLFLALPVTLREVGERYATVLALVLALFAIPTVIALNGANPTVVPLNGAEIAFMAGLMALAIWAVVGVYQRAAYSREMLAIAAASTVILSEFCVFAVNRPQLTLPGRRLIILDVLKLLQPTPAELSSLALALVFVVVLSVSFFVVLSVNTYVNHEDKHSNHEDKQSGLNLGRVVGGIAAVGLALTVFQAVKFLEFRSTTEEYRRAQIAKPDARFKFKAPFNFETFNGDVMGHQVPEDEWSDDERTRMRAFRDTIRTTAALKRP